MLCAQCHDRSKRETAAGIACLFGFGHACLRSQEWCSPCGAYLVRETNETNFQGRALIWMVEIQREAEPMERKVPGERRQVVGEPLARTLKHRLRALFVRTTLLRACNLQWIGDLQPECPTRTQRTLSELGSYVHNEVMIVDSRTQATQQWNSLRVESAAEGPPGPLPGTLRRYPGVPCRGTRHH